MENRMQEAGRWANKAKESFHKDKDRIENKQYRDYLEAIVLLGQADLAVRNMDSRGAACYYAGACKVKPGSRILLGEANNDQPSMLRTFYGFYGYIKKAEEAYGPTREELWCVIDVSCVYNEVLFAECHYERNEIAQCFKVLTRALQKIYELNTNGSVAPLDRKLLFYI